MNTITETLAEIKTLSKRLKKMRAFVLEYIVRDDKLKDPLLDDGGSKEIIKQKLQAITDIEKRMVRLRSAINKSNKDTTLTVAGVTQSVSDWLIWRREVEPDYRKFLVAMNSRIQVERENRAYSMRSKDTDASDLVVNVNEKELGTEAEQLEEILGTLDGQLSLLNATTNLEVE